LSEPASTFTIAGAEPCWSAEAARAGELCRGSEGIRERLAGPLRWLYGASTFKVFSDTSHVTGVSSTQSPSTCPSTG
jgi:hypothetical protein